MDKSKGQENSMQQFFSDHPSDGDRRDAYVKKLYEIGRAHV